MRKHSTNDRMQEVMLMTTYLPDNRLKVVWVVGDTIMKEYTPEHLSRLRAKAVHYHRTHKRPGVWAGTMTLVNRRYRLPYSVVRFLNNWDRLNTVEAA